MSTLDFAVSWHNAGIATIPILARSKTPALDSWREYQERLPSMGELESWFARPGYNLAVITGWRGLAVLDWDDVTAMGAWLAGLDDARAAIVLRTYGVKTARGQHLYFYCDNARCTHGDGWDIKAAGGYVLAPPSIHPSGRVYTALGNIATIQHISGIETLALPAATALPYAQAQTPCQDDPFDLAMRPHAEMGAIEAIKARVSIADVLGQQNGHGGRMWMTVCPLHGDTKPSFAVYADGHYFCYGCGAHGDVLTLHAAMHHISIRDAISELSASLHV